MGNEVLECSAFCGFLRMPLVCRTWEGVLFGVTVVPEIRDAATTRRRVRLTRSLAAAPEYRQCIGGAEYRLVRQPGSPWRTSVDDETSSLHERQPALVQIGQCEPCEKIMIRKSSSL